MPLTCFTGPGEIEPNNSVVESTAPLCSGHDYTGLHNDNFDFFWLDAAAGDITVELANQIGAGVQLQLHHQAISSDPKCLDYLVDGGFRCHVPNAPAGRYYIVVYTVEPNAGVTHYTLRVVFAEGN